MWLLAFLACGGPSGSADYYSNAPLQLPLLVTPDDPVQNLDVSVTASVVREDLCEGAVLLQGELSNACPDPVTLEVRTGDVLLDSLEIPGTLGAGSLWLDVESHAAPLPAELHLSLTLDGTCTPTGILDLTGWVHCEQDEQDHVVVTIAPL